jgi:phage recombination protein Bet
MGELVKNQKLKVAKLNNEYGIDASTWSALKNSLYTGAKDESILMVLDYCKAGKLDPMQKPVHIVPMSVKNAATGRYEFKDVIMPGIGLYRIQAARSDQYAGVSEPEYGEDIETTLGGVKITYPKWCKITVRKLINGVVVDFTAKEYWLENYASKKETATPNAMWAKRPYGQLAKCAEAQALRKAFPEFVSQHPTAEEMEGKVLQDVQASKQVDVTLQAKHTNLDNFIAQEVPQEAQLEVAKEDIHLKLGRIVKLHNVPQETIDKWCEKGGVSQIEDLDDEKTIACIKSLEADTFTNGHKTINQY